MTLQKFAHETCIAFVLALLATQAASQPASVAPASAAAPPPVVAGSPPVAQQSLFIVHLVTGPAWSKDKAPQDQAGFKEHSQNLARMRTEGSLVVGARYKDSTADKGLLLIRAASAAAVQAQFADDPMVRDKLFAIDIAEFQPFYDGVVARPTRDTGTPAAPLSALAWLAGCWSGRNEKTEFREHWMRPASGMMMGMGRTIAGGRVASFEAMRIELNTDGVPTFIAKPSGQAETAFKLLKQDGGEAVFENLSNDFPQRVRYQQKPDGTLHARIEGNRNGKERGIDFLMRRTGCE